MITLVWLIIIAGLLLAIVGLGLAIRRHEAHTQPRKHPRRRRGDRHMIDPMS